MVKKGQTNRGMGDFDKALEFCYSKNGGIRLHCDQISYLQTQLNNQTKTLTKKKLNLENQGLDPKTNAELLTIEKRLKEIKDAAFTFKVTSVKTIHKYDLIS